MSGIGSPYILSPGYRGGFVVLLVSGGLIYGACTVSIERPGRALVCNVQFVVTAGQFCSTLPSFLPPRRAGRATQSADVTQPHWWPINLALASFPIELRTSITRFDAYLKVEIAGGEKQSSNNSLHFKFPFLTRRTAT